MTFDPWALHQPASPGIPEKVYVVDDDASVRRALTRVLRSEGYEAAGFASAEDLLGAVLLDDPPACLVVDLRMPGLSGLDLQERLVEQHLDMGVVFISGRANVQSGVQAMKWGAVDFLSKPVDPDVLAAVVARAAASKFKDGKAVEHWIYMDAADMMKMMPAGNMPAMPATDATKK